MTTVSERLEAILDAIKSIPAQTWPVGDLAQQEAEHYVLARTVHSAVDLPARTVTRINGYAGVATELESADPEAPLLVEVSGDVTASDQIPPPHRPGQVWRVASGAPIPEGADTVVPLAHTDRHHRKVQIRRPGETGAHIWHAGKDVQAGDVLVEAGQELAPGVIAALIAAQVETVEVYAPARVGIVSTGTEMTEPGDTVEVGHIPDSNGPMIAGAVRLAGHKVVRIRLVDGSDASSAVRSLKGECDLIVVTAGVGGGPDDIVDDDLPNKIEFVDVDALPSIAPGFGTVGFGKIPVFALPGDPVDARIAFELFVRPALARRAGHGDYQAQRVSAFARAGWKSSEDVEEYLPVRLDEDVSGGFLATPIVGIAGLVGADGLALIDKGEEKVRVGDELSVTLLRPYSEIRSRHTGG